MALVLANRHHRHRIFEVEDIIRLIVDNLPKKDKKHTARLARTCRAFTESALDAVWREIPSVEPLFSLFPPNCINGNGPYDAKVSPKRVAHAVIGF